jgi:hypothetical protein
MQVTGYNCEIMDATRGPFFFNSRDHTRGPMGLCVEFTAASDSLNIKIGHAKII